MSLLWRDQLSIGNNVIDIINRAEHFTNFLRDCLINHVIKDDLLMKHMLQKFHLTSIQDN